MILNARSIIEIELAVDPIAFKLVLLAEVISSLVISSLAAAEVTGSNNRAAMTRR